MGRRTDIEVLKALRMADLSSYEKAHVVLREQIKETETKADALNDKVILDRSVFVSLSDFRQMSDRLGVIQVQVSSIMVVGVVAGLLIPIAVVIINHIWK